MNKIVRENQEKSPHKESIQEPLVDRTQGKCRGMTEGSQERNPLITDGALRNTPREASVRGHTCPERKKRDRLGGP